MKIDRRTFLQGMAMASFGLPLAPESRLPAPSFQSKPLRILILGGTGFIGPFQVRYALSRGHQVTVFNRGVTHPGDLPKEVEQLIGDRNGQLDALKGRQWDVVIDNPTTLPKWVRDAAQILKGNVQRYVFISQKQDNKHISEKRPVTVGKKSGNKLEIVKGLSAGDQILQTKPEN